MPRMMVGMNTSPAVSPRRMTSADERELLRAARELQAAEERVEKARAARDQLILEMRDSGLRVTDIAETLEMDRNAIYLAIERARRA